MNDDFQDDFQDDFLWPAPVGGAPIPKIFHSLESGGPFANCLVCDRSLLENDVEYSIEIVFKGREPIVEMAVCHECRGELTTQISLDSMARIQEYVDSKVEFIQRTRNNAIRALEGDEDAWLNECVLTGAKRTDCVDWQIYGLFRGDRVQLGFSPLMISGLATEEMSELLSEQTRGWMNDFLGDRFGMPPEFCDSPDWTPILL